MTDKKPTIDELRHEYITTSISQRALADKYDINVYSFEKNCKNEGWVGQRQAYRKSTAKKAVAKTENSQAAHLASLIENTDLLGKLIIKSMKRIMSEDDPDERRAATIGKAWNDYLKSNVMVRGLMTPLEAAQLEMARERSANERKRLEHDIGDEATQVEIIISKQAEEWGK